MIVALNIRFNQETIDMIKSVPLLLDLQISNENINLLKDTFDVDSNLLKKQKWPIKAYC